MSYIKGKTCLKTSIQQHTNTPNIMACWQEGRPCSQNRAHVHTAKVFTKTGFGKKNKIKYSATAERRLTYISRNYIKCSLIFCKAFNSKRKIQFSTNFSLHASRSLLRAAAQEHDAIPLAHMQAAPYIFTDNSRGLYHNLERRSTEPVVKKNGEGNPLSYFSNYNGGHVPLWVFVDTTRAHGECSGDLQNPG